MKLNLVKDKNFYIGVFRLMLPMAAMNALSIILNFCDTVMLGKLGADSEAAISAASIASQPFWVYSFFLFGAISGASVLASQYWGKKDTLTINKIVGTTAVFLFLMAVIIILISLVFGRNLMRVLSNDEQVVELSVIYLKILLISFLPNTVTVLFSGVLRTTENVRIPLLATTTGILTNIFFNYCLIFGNFGFPAFGIKGAAIATVIARVIEMIIILTYVVFFESNLKITVKKMFAFNMLIIKDFIKYSMPVIVNEASWGFGITIHAAIIGSINKEQYAAYTIANVVERVAMLTMIGYSNAAAILIGKAIGEGKENKVIVQYAKTFSLLSTSFVAVLSLIVFVSKNFIVNIFDIGDTTKYYTNILICIICVFVFLKNFNCLCIVGIFRGGGDTGTGAIIDPATMYLWGIPTGLIMRFVFNMPVSFVYAFLISDEIAKLPIVIYRLISYKWIKNITRKIG